MPLQAPLSPSTSGGRWKRALEVVMATAALARGTGKSKQVTFHIGLSLAEHLCKRRKWESDGTPPV